MRETKDKQLVINIEESFHSKFMALCDKEGVSASSLGRRLVIRHLMTVGVLPESVALETLL